MKKLFLVFPTLVLLLSISVSNLYALNIVVPNANEFVEGPGDNGLPFNTFSSLRYQQIFSSDQFPDCGLITEINYRFGEDTQGSSVTYPSVFIQLSTTDVTPGELNTTFSLNIGSNVRTVYNGPLSFSAPPCVIGPCPFDSMITLETPFLYNPSEGNLLLDITIEDGQAYESFDSVNNVLSITRRAFSDDIDSETGTVDNTALVTQFVCIPRSNIPTLSEWGLIAMAGVLGIIGFIAIRKKYATS